MAEEMKMGRAAALPYRIKVGRAEVLLRQNFPTIGGPVAPTCTAEAGRRREHRRRWMAVRLGPTQGWGMEDRWHSGAERDSVSRSIVYARVPPRISATSGLAKLLRVADPRSYPKGIASFSPALVVRAGLARSDYAGWAW